MPRVLVATAGARGQGRTEMKWRDWFGEHTLFLVSLAVLLAAPLLAWWSGGKPVDAQSAVLLATAVVILHYTYETHRMRQELVHQNRLAVQPLVLATVKKVEVSRGTFDLRVVLRNIGKGPALFVHADDFNVLPCEGGGQLSCRIRPVDYLESGQEISQDVDVIVREATGKESLKPWHYAIALDPEYARDTHIVTVRYEDIDRGQYWAKIQMGTGGIRLLDHGLE